MKRGLVAFTAVFAALAALVFWGAWSTSVAPVMPDDSIWHPLSSAAQFAEWFRGWVGRFTFVPTDLVWSGMLGLQYAFQEFKYVVGLYVAALGLSFFLRGRGLSVVAAYGAGLLLAFCGYWCTLFSAGHGGWFIAMSYVIPAFAVFDRALTTGKFHLWVLLGIFAGWGTYIQQDLYLLFMILLSAYAVYAFVRERKLPWKGMLAALAFFLLAGAPGIRSSFTEALAGRETQIAESMGTTLSGGKASDPSLATTDAEKSKKADEARWIFVTNWSMPPEDTLEFFIPRIHGDTSCPMTLQLARAAGKDLHPYNGRLGRPINAPSGNYRQHSLYVGWVTCLLAVFGLVLGIRKRGTRISGDVLFFGVAAILCWMLSMGRFCEPTYRIIYHLPFGDAVRCPVKWHHLTEFCLCALAGFGLEWLLVSLRSRAFFSVGRRAAILVAAVAVIGAFDLARQDSLFCAPIDLTIVKARNSAADEIVSRGKGTLCDLAEGGRGLLGWSFQAHGVGVTGEINKDVRFVLAPNDMLKTNRQLAGWLKNAATPIGSYQVTSRGVRATSPQTANVSLYQLNGVPPPSEPKPVPADWFVRLLGIVSLTALLVAPVCLWRELRCRASASSVVTDRSA